MKRSFSRKTKLFRKKRHSTKKHKGGLKGSLYGGVLDIKDENLKKALNAIPRFKMSVANFLSTAVSKTFAYVSTPFGHGLGYGYRALMHASWSDSRARKKILDKLNDAKTNEKNIKFPHIWNNVSVDNKIIRNPVNRIENSHIIFGSSYYHPSTLGYNYECDVNYPNWHGSKLEHIRLGHFGNNTLEHSCDSNATVYDKTRDEWLMDNPLEKIAFDYNKLKGYINIAKEDKEIIKSGFESGVRAVQQIKQAGPEPGPEPGPGPGPEPEPVPGPGPGPGPEPVPGPGPRGGKHKSRRVTKHKRK